MRKIFTGLVPACWADAVGPKRNGIVLNNETRSDRNGVMEWVWNDGIAYCRRKKGPKKGVEEFPPTPIWYNASCEESAAAAQKRQQTKTAEKRGARLRNRHTVENNASDTTVWECGKVID